MMLLTYLKWRIRQSTFYRKRMQRWVNNARYQFRVYKYYGSKYNFRATKIDIKNKSRIIFIFDPQREHPGVVDQLKAMIGMYYIAKISNLDYKIIHDDPFSLKDYLVPKSVKWDMPWEELSYNLNNVKIIYCNGQNPIKRVSGKYKQYHVYSYIGYDYLVTNKINEWKKVWKQLYDELFTPSEALLSEINRLNLLEKSYIAIHLRFVNTLDFFEKGEYQSLSVQEKNNLIENCINQIEIIRNQNLSVPVVVFSDSELFLSKLDNIDVTVLGGKIQHISQSSDSSTIMKTFVDFYLISRAKKVYSLIGPNMYHSVFPLYASVIGEIDFEQIDFT